MTSSTVVPPKKVVTPAKDSAVREVCHLYHLTNHCEDAVKFNLVWQFLVDKSSHFNRSPGISHDGERFPHTDFTSSSNLLC